MAEVRELCERSGAALTERVCVRDWKETDAGESLGQMPKPSDDVLSADGEFSATDDERSDSAESFPEAWTPYGRFNFDEESLEEDYTDSHLDTTKSEPQPSIIHNEEDWDAEMRNLENPYDEEDLVDISWSEHIAPVGITLLGDGSYLPSLHHAASIEFREAHNAVTMNFEAGQFEDAEQ